MRWSHDTMTLIQFAPTGAADDRNVVRCRCFYVGEENKERSVGQYCTAGSVS